MKLQRYHVTDSVFDEEVGCGPFCRGDHVEALEAENAALHAECDRLAAMLGPQKPMSAEEVTQPGFYWHRYGIEELCVVDVDYGYPYGRLFIWTNGEQDHGLEGQFVGPIKMPEV